ncbi:hypothetical protein, partial [Neisseria meningitidis]|uniref:hypothetical protein n=1 Tax=Neisseria meningitidis TaxID=487 RepID=UPI001EE02F7E
DCSQLGIRQRRPKRQSSSALILSTASRHDPALTGHHPGPIVGNNLPRVAVVDNSTVFDSQHSVKRRRQFQVMGAAQDLLIQAFKGVPHHLPVSQIQQGCWLVGEDD